MVSVVIPTHNRADLLPRAINSALNQTIDDIEIIVVSDGSTDGTDSLMDKCACDSRVKYIKYTPARGGNYARNTGIKVAKGEFVAFLDDDDEWLPTKLEKQLVVMESDKSIGLVYTGTHTIYVDCHIEYNSIPSLQGDMSRRILYDNFAGSTTTVMIRKAILEKTGLFDEKLLALQDYDLWIRICQCAKVGVVSEALVNYYNYNSTNQISANYKKYEDAYDSINRKYTNLYTLLSSREMKKKLAEQKISIGNRALRIGERNIAWKYYWQSLWICFRPKIISIFFASIFNYKFLLIIRQYKQK